MVEKIKSLVPDSVYKELPMVMERFSIDTPLRLSHWISQVAHESGGFTRTSENLNYSSQGLLVVFKKHFPAIEIANEYAHNQERIGNRVYGSRGGNGDEKSGDGFKFRGRGFIQLTFKNNYAEFDKFVEEDILSHPELVATKYALLSAGWFWNSHKLNVVAELGPTDDIIKRITKDINGGTNGLKERTELFHKYYSKLNS